jgi:uncharacterized membrane protein YedE/YeeE
MSDIPATTSIRRTSSSRIKETPEQRKRKRTIQITLGIIVVAAYIALCFYVQTVNPKGAFIMIIGLALGYTLQRSRFCFTAAMRDPVLTGSTSLTKAVIMAFVLSSILYAALQIKLTGMNLETLDVSKLPGNIKAVGLNTVIGGFLFGIGAVIAGGCASGTFMRMGEGFLQQWLVIIFFVTGSVFGSALMLPMKDTFLYPSTNIVFLPQALGGWIPALIFQFLALAVLYLLADWYGKKKAGEL